MADGAGGARAGLPGLRRAPPGRDPDRGWPLGLYGLYRAATEPGPAARRLGAGGRGRGWWRWGWRWRRCSGCRRRSCSTARPRRGGLTWEELTYGSWHPELLPTLLVREAYGTRARDTDWIDGYYPYHEMDVSSAWSAWRLAVVGAAAYRDRWVGFWVLLAGLGGVLMLGRYTFLFDRMHRVPSSGSARIPVRYHLWVSLAVAALAAVGVDRLSRPGPGRASRGRDGPGRAGGVSAAIAFHAYAPGVGRRREPLADAGADPEAGRRGGLGPLRGPRRWPCWRRRSPRGPPGRRGRGRGDGSPRSCRSWRSPTWSGSHWRDVPTVAPGYWTEPPESVARLRADPGLGRIFSYSRGAWRPAHRGMPWACSTRSRPETRWRGTSPRSGACRRRGATPRSTRGGWSGTASGRGRAWDGSTWKG